MFIRPPVPQPLANSTARMALVFRNGSSQRVIAIGGTGTVALIVLGALLFAWFLVATLYLAFKDEVVFALLDGQRRQHYAYEDRVVELRARIDRLTAKQVLNQDTIEDRVASLVARQAELEARHVLVAEFRERATEGGVALPPVFTTGTTALPGAARAFAPEKPQPLPGNDERARVPLPPTPGGLPQVLREVERRADAQAEQQIEALAMLEAAASRRAEHARIALAATGLPPARFKADGERPAPLLRMPEPLDRLQLRDVASEPTAIGGPLLPPAPGTEAGRFEHQAREAERAVLAAAEAGRVLRALPIARPLGVEHEITSGFGNRLDPFTRSSAQHAGIDFRAPTGTRVRAAADGQVIEAGTNGGYGRMVEIDHGFGLTTRYAHLSAIDVSEGQRVTRGQVLGRVGSTGRSTGPHLHYEVRVDDDARDPMRFVRAERLLSARP